MINIPNERNRFFYIASTIILGGILCFQVLVQFGGTSHMESNCFLILYNFTPDLLKTIFDPLRTDWNLYQGRELSYFIDSIDARFIGWCIKHKMAHFYSLSAVLAAIAILIVQQWGLARGFSKINCYLGVLFSAIWQLTPCNFSHHFFRCGKPLTALFITMLLFSMRVLYVDSNKKSRVAAWILLGISVLCLPLFDRQGLFLLAAATFFSAIAFVVCQESMHKRLFKITAVAGVCSILIETVFNVFLTPVIVNKLNGYTPSFEYQQMPFSAVFDFKGTIYFLFDNIGYWLTGFDNAGLIALCLLPIMCWKLYKNGKQPVMILIIYIFAVLCAMANLMMFRHHLLILDGVNHSAYFMPFAAVLLFAAVVVSDVFEWKKSIVAIFVIVFASSMTFSVFCTGDPVHNRFHRHSTPRILKALNDKNINPRQMLMPYSAWKLVDAFQGNLRGWELGGIPIDYSKY